MKDRERRRGEIHTTKMASLKKGKNEMELKTYPKI